LQVNANADHASVVSTAQGGSPTTTTPATTSSTGPTTPTPGAELGGAAGVGGAPSGGPDGSALQKQVADLTAENARLKKEHADIRAKADREAARAGTSDDRIAQLERDRDTDRAELASERANREKLEKSNRFRDAVEKSIAGVLPEKQKLARAAAKDLGVEGLDSDNPAAAIKTVNDQLRKEFPELFAAAKPTTPGSLTPPPPSNGAGTSGGFKGVIIDGIRKA